MNPCTRTLRLLIATGVVALLAPATSAGEGLNFELGVGAGIAPDYEGSEDYEPVPLLNAKVEKSGLYLELENFTLRANLVPRPLWRAARAAGKPIWTFGPMANYRPERDDVDNGTVDDLRKIDAAIEVGAFAGFAIDRLSAGVEFLHDVTDEHDGLLLTLRGEYAVAVSEQIRMSIGVSSTWANDEYMDTYFGIDADNAVRSGLKTFNADAGVKDLGVRVRVAYQLFDGWTVSGLASYRRLLGDAADSPIVDDEGSANQFLGGVSIGFAF